MSTVYRREGDDPKKSWNELIRRVNELADECSLEHIPLTQNPHKWSKSDIQEVQDKLREICDDNEFDPIPDTWKQSVIDEFVAAIDAGACCGLCNADGTLAFEPLETGAFGDCIIGTGTHSEVTCSEEVEFFPGSSTFIREHRLEHTITFKSQCILEKNFPGLQVLGEVGEDAFVWELIFVTCRSPATKQSIENTCPGVLDVDVEEILAATGPIDATGKISFVGATPDPIQIIYPRATNVGFKFRTRQT